MTQGPMNDNLNQSYDQLLLTWEELIKEDGGRRSQKNSLISLPTSQQPILHRYSFSDLKCF